MQHPLVIIAVLGTYVGLTQTLLAHGARTAVSVDKPATDTPLRGALFRRGAV